MKHHNTIRKFGRVRKVRTALTRSLIRSLILEGGITTTFPKAKEIQPLVEELITKSKVDTVANRRFVASKLNNCARATKKLFLEIGPLYRERKGGYTRVVRTGVRLSDGAVEAHIAFV